jgi:hypothetical protein
LARGIVHDIDSTMFGKHHSSNCHCKIAKTGLSSLNKLVYILGGAMMPGRAKKLSPQAAYQRRRRAERRPITFFPEDRARLDQAVHESGLGQQVWIAKAVRERLMRQERVRELLDEAIRRFGAKCLWNTSLNQPIARLVPEIYTRLRKYGGMEGIKLAMAIEALSPEDVRWR